MIDSQELFNKEEDIQEDQMPINFVQTSFTIPILVTEMPSLVTIISVIIMVIKLLIVD